MGSSWGHSGGARSRDGRRALDSGTKGCFQCRTPVVPLMFAFSTPFPANLKVCVCILIGKRALSERRAWVGMQLASLYVCFRGC